MFWLHGKKNLEYFSNNFIKKILGITVLGLLLSGNAYAGVNEPGVTSIAGCDRSLKSVNKK